MIRNKRDETREQRKLQALESFQEGKKLFTNDIAKNIKVVWPVADRILRELLDEGKLVGGKVTGYMLPKKKTIWGKITKVLHV